MATISPPSVTVRASRTPTQRRWSVVTDGPPLWLVAMTFGVVLASWLAPGAPAVLAQALGASLLLTLVLEFPRWGGHLVAQRRLGASDPTPLRQRLDQARARRIERDRWQ